MVRMIGSRLWTLVLLALAPPLGACGSGQEPDPIAAVPGTKLVFDLAHSDDERAFFDFPYPSDRRLDELGRPALASFPNPKSVSMVGGLKRIAGERPGFPVLPVAYFRFDGPVSARALSSIISPEASAPILLIDVDASSPERGRLYATVASTLQPDDVYVPEHLLAIAAYPGIVLAPGRRYAFVVLRAALDAAGAPLGVPLDLELLKAGKTPAGAGGAELAELHAPLWQTLDAIGVPRADVAAATVFTTGDVVADTERLSRGVVQREDVAIENLAVDPDDGAAHPRFCELHATVRFPQFQQGTPPFDTEGSFALGSDDLPIVQREESAPVVITLPRTPMPPDGYPLVIYFHGSGGVSTQVVDRGQDGAPQGQGPAHVLAAHGFASVGSAHPLNPERLPGASEIEYLNFDNLAAFRDTFRQGVIEQRLLIEALSRLEIPGAVVSACALPPPPGGAAGYRLDLDPLLAMGQSMGGMYTNLIGAVEPRIAAVVPTGAGGFWSAFIVQTKLIGNLGTLAGVLLGLHATIRLEHVHPALHLLQTAWEPAEPMVHLPRLGKNPLPDHPVRSIYEPVGKDDSYFPTSLYDAIALAYGHHQAGEIIWPSMQESLAIDGLDGVSSYPVKHNLVSESGTPFTGVVVQYAGDGSFDPHVIFSQLDSVKYQYGCFFESFIESGTAVVVAPAPLGTPCP
jgi:hypothetical protein